MKAFVITVATYIEKFPTAYLDLILKIAFT